MQTTTTMYRGGAMDHQQPRQPEVTLPPQRHQGQPPQIIRDLMPTEAQLGERTGREMAAGWSYDKCRDWIDELDRGEVDAPDCDDAKREFRAGLRLGVGVRMAEREDDPARRSP